MARTGKTEARAETLRRREVRNVKAGKINKKEKQ